MRTPRLAVALLAAALLSSACGARLSEEQRQEALSQFGGGGGGTGAASQGITPEGVESTAGPSLADPGGELAAPGGPAAPGGGTVVGGAEAPTGTQGTEATTGTQGTEAITGTQGSGGGAGGGPAGDDTRKAPAGGNGGSTDKGITGDTITVSNVSDISGAVPGLFEDAQLAAKAYVAYFAAREGTIYGRKLKLLALDSRLDAGANRSASLQACEQSFAGVGSVSAFDQGGAPVIRDCGLPDLRGLATTTPMKKVPNAFPMNAAGTGGSRSMGTFGWAAQKFPQAIKKAAYIYIDGEVTRELQQEDAAGAVATLGYDFVLEPAIGITETNYAPIVQQLKSKDVQYVTFVGAYQQAAALAQEFTRQNFKPQVFQPTVTAYTPDFIRQAGAAAEGTYVAVTPSLNEEIGGNPELKLYAQWLNQVKPGATPTGIGQYAWAATALFVEKMKAIGAKPTRKALLAEMSKVRNFTGNNLFPAQDVGGRKLASCTKIVQVKGGKFVRIEPAAVGKDRCGDPIWNNVTKKAEAGFPK